MLPRWNLSLLLLLAKATLILCAALGITLSLRRASAGARHLVWLVTLGTLLVVPALTMWAPLRVAVLSAPAARSVAPANESAVGNGPVANVPSTVAASSSMPSAADPRTNAHPTDSRETNPPARLGRMSALSVAFGVWACVALAILAVLAWAGFSVRRIIARARPLTDSAWQGPLFEIADRIGLDDAPRLLQSDDAKMPFACGVRTPTIVLPAEAERWTLDRRRAVLLHELAHIRRRDLLGHSLGRVTCALYWFHPLVWTAARQLRSESERACDDLALACGTRATDYAEHLLDIVTSVRGDATPLVALAMARRSEFEGRMLAILDPELRRGSPTRRQSAYTIAALSLAALVIGVIVPVPRAAEAEVPTATHMTAPPAAPSAPSLIARDRRDPPAPPAHSITHSVDATVQSALNQSSVIDKAGDGRTASQTPGDDRPVLLAKVLGSDPNADLRRVAAWGLQQYADSPVAVTALANAVAHDANASVREMSAWALAEGDANQAAVLTALTAAVRNDANEKVRATAAWALGNIGDNASVDALVAALGDASTEVRQRAAWALGNVGPTSAPKALTKLLGDADPRTRSLAAWALYQIADPATAPAVEAALKNERDKDVQLADIRAIAAMGERSVDALRGLLESSDPAVKAMAVRALARGDATGPWPNPWPQPRPFP